MAETKVELYKNKADCCGCGACFNICPKNAIAMCKDDCGFVYPEINDSLCIGCKKCINVCNYQHDSGLLQPVAEYASAIKDYEVLLKSASGGIFSAAAKKVLDIGGCVFGAAFVKRENSLIPKHIKIETESELSKIQGSKYVQSDTGTTYKEAETELKKGKTVLYSGTPCQIDGLKGFLGRDYDNLFTIDIICHGVPNADFFNDYVKELMNKYGGEIMDFKFRDKTKGWGLNAKVIYTDTSKKEHYKLIPSGASSYFDMFLKSDIYRENCYSCKYARTDRAGDITIGDFWGFQKQHPQLLESAGGNYSDISGISCVLVNTEKGRRLVELLKESVFLDKSSFDKISEGNSQLKHPSVKSAERDTILTLYKDKGYPAVEKYFRHRNGLRTQYYYIKNALPRNLKNTIKKIVKR